MRTAVVTAAAVAVPLVAPGDPGLAGSPHRPGYTVVVEPWGDAVPNTPPVVDLTATCRRNLRGGGQEVVFGYVNHAAASRLVLIEDPQDPDAEQNVIVRKRMVRGRVVDVGVERFGPQVTQFLPGDHPEAFAVAFARRESVAWQVRVPAFDESGEGWRVTVQPQRLPRCGRDVAQHFAVVQAADVVIGIGEIERNHAGAITSWSVTVAVENVSVACSRGGTPLPATVIVGWQQPDEGLVPLTSLEYILTLADGAVYDMSTDATRAVLDVTEPYEFFGPPVDVVGRCAFGASVTESEAFWAGLPQFGRFVPVIEGGVVVDFEVGLVLPGGVRIR